MKQIEDEKLILEFDTLRRKYIKAESKLRKSYMKKIQKTLNKISTNLRIKELN